MAVSPAEAEEMIVEDVRKTYADAEQKMIEKVADLVKRGGFEGDNWKTKKLNQLQELNDWGEEVIDSQLREEKDKVKRAVKQAYSNGVHDAEDALIESGKVNSDNVVGAFNQVDKETVRSLSRGIEQSLNSVDQRILRSTGDAYRNVIANASRQGVTGVSTRQQVAQEAMEEFAQRGITGFVDNGGKAWSMRSYTEMATRSAMGRASLNGSMNRMKANDHDLAMVGTSYEPCSICMPWEGRILSISGESDEYPSVDEAEADGLWHPNCTHSISPYVEGVTEKPEIDKEKKRERYENRQTQRYNERQIRKWKRKKAGAVTDQDEQFAKAKIAEWQKKQEDFIEETGRYRKYGREQVADIDMPDVKSKTAAGRYVDSNDWEDALDEDQYRDIHRWTEEPDIYENVRKLQRPDRTAMMRERYQGIADNMEDALEDAPIAKGKVYRGMHSMSEKQVKAMANDEYGFTLDAFTSASKSKGVGLKFAKKGAGGKEKVGKGLLMEIDSKTGKDIASAGLRGEEEVLFEKGTTLIPQELIDNGDHWVLKVEEYD